MKFFRKIFILIIVLVFILFRIFVGETCVVPSPSMEPTIMTGDVLWINKVTYGSRLPQRWADIPIINIFTWIKPLRIADEKNDWGYLRFVGMKKPLVGDLVVFNSPEDNNTLLVKRITKIHSEKILNNVKLRSYYFVEGDNKENSRDSRSFGYIPESAIIGKVNRSLFSIERSGEKIIGLRDNIAQRVPLTAVNTVPFVAVKWVPPVAVKGYRSQRSNRYRKKR